MTRDMGRPPDHAAKRPEPNGAEGANEGIRSVDRAIDLLMAFRADDDGLTLTELADRSDLHKTTASRLLATLQRRGLVAQTSPGGYRLGSAILALHTVFNASLDLQDVVRPALVRLARESRESAAFYVREGERRRCMFRVDSPQIVRDHAAVGTVSPLEVGSFGRALLAFSDAREAASLPGLPLISRGENNPDVCSIASPVLGQDRSLIGSLGISVPIFRFRDDQISGWCRLVMREAVGLSGELGGDAGLLEGLAAGPGPRPSGRAPLAASD